MKIFSYCCRAAIGRFHASFRDHSAWSAWDADLFLALLNAAVLNDVLANDDNMKTDDMKNNGDIIVLGSSHISKDYSSYINDNTHVDFTPKKQKGNSKIWNISLSATLYSFEILIIIHSEIFPV